MRNFGFLDSEVFVERKEASLFALCIALPCSNVMMSESIRAEYSAVSRHGFNSERKIKSL
jgi:hypothetical protein